MTGDDIGFADISDVYRNERKSKTLTRLPVNFYLKAEEHLGKLRAEHCEAIKVPNNPASMMLWDQITKLDKRLQHIYEIRERKIALAALDSMLGAQQPDNMTKKDKALYVSLVGTLTAFRTSEGPECIPPDTPKAEPAKPVQATISEPMLTPEPEMQAIEETVMVHVLEDIPAFVSLKDTYNLKKDDMVTLPDQFARLLSSKGKVRIVA